MGKLTEAFLKSIEPPEKGRAVFTDGDGLQLRVTSNGVRSWSQQYVFEGRKKKHTLGKYPAISLKEARRLSAASRLDVARGVDPNAAKAKAKEASKKKTSVSALFEVYDKRHVSGLRERTAGEYRRVFMKDILPVIGQKGIEELSKSDVIEMVDDIADRAPVLANRVLTYVRAFCNWCISRDYIQHNPTIGIRKPLKEVGRERILSIDEMRSLVDAARRELPQSHFDAFEMLALSCMRRQEVCQMSWAEVQSDRIKVAAERSKNHRSYDTPVTDDIATILERRVGECDQFVFGSGGEGKPIDFNSRMLKRVGDLAGVSDWTLHDFRRAATTYMEDHGIHRFVVERVLSHADTSTTGIYAKSDYFDAKKRALELWGDAVFGRNIGTTIVPFATVR